MVLKKGNAMNLLRTSRNITIIALLLSLLFHLSTVFYIFLQKKHADLFSENKDVLEQALKQEQQKKHTPWVETKARADTFGAPVFFEDIIEDIPQENESASIDQIQNQEAPQKPVQENDTIDPQDIIQKIQEKEAVPTREKAVMQTIMQHIKPIEKPVRRPPKKPTPAQKNPFTNYPTASNKPKPPITLADLTQGFLNQRKEQSGPYNISMLGVKHGLPSDEQMKYERYLQKLSWCIQSSFKIHRQPQFSIKNNPHVFFSLNRDGILQKLSIRKSSGNIHADEYLLFIFRDASSSFPPVPHYLTDDPFNITCTIY